MTKNINTILFDLDGTLIDTNNLIITSFLHTLNKYYPGEYERDDVIPFMGPSLIDTFSKINPDLAEKMVHEYRTFNVAKHDELVTEFPGVYETVKKLAEENFKMAIVTTKRRDVALQGLRLMHLEPYFSAIVANDDVEQMKPHPEPIYLALDHLQSSADEALMVGDNFHDIVAGQNAGTKTAGVAWSLKGREFLEEYQPDYMLNIIEDILPIVGVNK